jgi:hypothetical protein
MINRFGKLTLFFSLVIFLNSLAMSQSQKNSLDSVKTSASSDTVILEKNRISNFNDSVFQYFSIYPEISLNEMESSIKKDLGEVLHQNSWMGIDRFGFLGQFQSASLGGRGKGKIFVDGFSPAVLPLYFPQVGGSDLNSYALESVEKIRFWYGGIEDILGWSEGKGAIELSTKNLKTEEPYSRFWVDRGNWGFKRTQVEFGRKITKSTKVYLTGTFRASGGDTIFSNSDSRYLSAKTSFNLKKWDGEIFFYENRNKNSYPYDFDYLSPSIQIFEGRREDKNWGSQFLFTKNLKENSSLSFSFNYHKSDQEILNNLFKQKSWQEKWGFKSDLTYGLEGQFFKVSGYLGWDNFRIFNPEKIVDGYSSGNLIPSRLHQMMEGYLSIANLFPFFFNSQGLLFFRLEKKKLSPFDISGLGGISYSLASSTKLFFTWGWIKTYPDVAELYLDSLNYDVGEGLFYRTGGNPRFKKGNSLVLSLGGNTKFSDFSAGGVVAFQKSDNVILWLQNGIGEVVGDFYPINRNLKFWEANFFLKYKKNRFVESGISYSYKNESEKLYVSPTSSLTSKRQVAFLPFHTLSGFVQVGREFLKKEMEATIRIDGRIESEKYLTDYFYDKRTTPGVEILSARATLRFLDLHIYYVTDNIFNKRVVAWDNYYLPGRNMWIGFYWEFFN